ncbi:MAG: hypothetical protein IPJ88_08030 [Myxococcales bacterium]|nr:MAG: hypothetical protein IPJ88_08030 [Myxococcales bacterium]
MSKASFEKRMVYLALLIVLAVMVIRVTLAAHAEYEEAATLQKSGDLDSAIVHYRRAARWYLPLFSTPTRALDQLERIANTYKKSGDVHGALAARRSMRAAIMSSRSFYTPHGDYLERSNREIASLMASLPPLPKDVAKSKASLRKDYFSELEHSRGPNTFWTLVLLLGFALWVGGAFVFFHRAFGPEQQLLKNEAVRWGGLVFVGIFCFVLGASLA